MSDITGRCLCGRVRYTATEPAAFTGLCHCRNCQRYTGSAFEPIMAFPAAAISVSGILTIFESTGDSGQPVRRRFCPHCGSGVFAEADIIPGTIFVLAGTLDDPGVFQPTMDIYCRSARPWVGDVGARRRFQRMPEL